MQYDDQSFDLLRAEFGDVVDALNTPQGDPWIGIRAEAVADVGRYLRDTPSTAFDFLNDLCVVDYLSSDKKLAKAVGEERLTVVYQLSSLARKRRITLKATLPRWKPGTTDQPPELPSVADIWRTAEWHEREAYDLSGVIFTGHPGLTRILCPDDWVGHPLRKDYQMPLEYHGIRGR